jgi:hypothetical protein
VWHPRRSGPGSIAGATEPASKTVANAPVWRFRPIRVTIPDAVKWPCGRSSGPRRGGRGFASPPPQAPPWRPCLSPSGLRPHQPAWRRDLPPSRSNPRRIGRGSAFSRTLCSERGVTRYHAPLAPNTEKQKCRNLPLCLGRLTSRRGCCGARPKACAHVGACRSR